ncbi:hypothetical protein RNJ44_02238 [Nakaseomyces bracarensis]|uniref:Late endosomal/lysosomal adaptor and MAPK and MTOR activator 5 n=1 Tax=Nakaseomyces bracarensis TaxID=273131 RepID=A0ABR4NN23_9SACH
MAKLSDTLPGAVGLMTFDDQNNLIVSDGLAKDKTSDIPYLAKTAVNEDGLAVLEQGSLLVHLYKKDGNTLVVYTNK